jgi:hypothetical protein
MPGKSDLFKEELDQLSDQEIEARLAAAVWVDDKRAAVLRYLEEKKLCRKKAAQSEELEIALMASAVPPPSRWAVRREGYREVKNGTAGSVGRYPQATPMSFDDRPADR